MKRYYLILLSLCQLALFGQGYSRVEYFIDTDPGIGSATTAPLPIGDSTQFVANISNINSGLHTMYIRVKDSKGHWSQTISRPFMKQAVPRDATITIAKAEYFVDTDPGFGKATNISNISGETIDATVDLTSIESGLHSLYIRTLDTQGHWSQTISRPFMNQTVPRDATITIAKAEYFVDTDPGFGKATNISNISGETIDATVDLTSIESGLHSLYIRTLDTQGHWSQTISRQFMKSNLKISNPDIVTAEYFIDAVGDFGKGKTVGVSAQSNSVIIDVLADLKDLLVGNHAFYVRAKDNNGQWSMIQKVDFQVVANTAVINLSDNEKLILYPNPTTNGFKVKGLESKATLTLYNLKGETLITKEFIENETISVSTLPKGIYMVKINTAEGLVERKLVKK